MPRTNEKQLSAKRVAEQYFRNTFIRPLLHKQADSRMDPQDDEEQEALIDAKKALKEGYKLITPKLYTELRRAFGPTAGGYFAFYRFLRGVQLGRPVPEDLPQQYAKLVRIMANMKGRKDHKKISPSVKTRLFKTAKKIIPKLQVVVRAAQSDPTKRGATQTWRPIIEQLSVMVEMLARDKGVYLKIGRRVGTGGAKWPVFYKMRPKEEEMQRLADEDPETFESVQRLHKTVEQLNERAMADIQKDGLIPEKTRVSGRWVNIGVSEETKIALDELRKRQSKLNTLLGKTNKTWKKWWRKVAAFDEDAQEELKLWLKANPEPEMMPKSKLREMHKYWARREPKDGGPDAMREWKEDEPSIDGLKKQIQKLSDAYQDLQEEYLTKSDEIVYDHDGTRLPLSEFKEKRKEYLQSLKQLMSDDLVGDERLDAMRVLSEDTLNSLDAPVSSVSLTDDDAKKHRLTRVFPVKEVPIEAINRILPPDRQLFTGLPGERRRTVQVVTSGRYAGVPVDHLVNENGRMIERTEYTFDTRKGKRGRPKRDPTGFDQTQREPFVTLGEDGRLFLSVSGDDKWKDVADSLQGIAGYHRLFKGRISVKGVTTPGSTITIGTEVLTAVEGPRTPGANDFSISSGESKGIAADIAMAIRDGRNTLAEFVTASSRMGNVTVTALPGREEAYPISVSDAASFTTSEGALKEQPLSLVKARRLANPPGFEKDTSYYKGAKDEKGEKTRKSGQHGFYFTPENFALVKDKIGAMALSEGAVKHLEDYFEDLTRAEKATEDKNLAPFAHQNLGGFRDWVLDGKGEEWLKEKQKYEALQRQHGDDPRAAGWARKAQQFRDKLNRPKKLLEMKRKLEDALQEKPNDPRAAEWAEKLDKLEEAFRNEELGGFEFQLLGLQKKALAWMESRGDNGVCSLDTGIGKTLTSLAMIQKLIRDGLTDEEMLISPEEAAKVNIELEKLREIRKPDAATQERIRKLEESPAVEYPSGTNGRFLYVAPSRNLLGNLDKEAVGFLSEEGYAVTGSKIDAMVAKGRNSFQATMNKKPGEDTAKVQRGGGEGEITIDNFQQEATRYTAVFFDEAHEYMNKSTGAAGKAFLGFKHPRKIVLTASPMTNEPMDAYLLASVCNNNDLSDTGTPEGRRRRSDMREWKERYCETVGGRVVGAKKGDPTVERDLKTWARTNLFFADKQSVDEDWARPPKLERDSDKPGGGTNVLMDPEVEKASKAVAGQVQDQLKNLYLRFRDKGYLPETKMVIDPETGKEEEIVVPGQSYPGAGSQSGVHDPDLEKFTKLNVKPYFDLMTMLSTAPELAVVPKIDARVKNPYRKRMEKLFAKLFPGKKAGDRVFPDLTTEDNPKFQKAKAIVSEALANDPDTGTSRVLMWSDNKDVVIANAKTMSKTEPGIHAAALANGIRLFKGGSELKTYIHPGGKSENAWDLPFKKKLYKLYKNMPKHPKKNPGMGRGEQFKWTQFVTKNFIQGNRDVRSMTCFGPAYQSGQNFQGFQTVVHLDRDHWNNENMKQRTARAYRQGQKNTVQEITLDASYEGKPKPGDASLDEIRRLQQSMEGSIFDGIVKASQDHPLGTEWTNIQQRLSKYTHTDKKALEMLLAPGSLSR